MFKQKMPLGHSLYNYLFNMIDNFVPSKWFPQPLRWSIVENSTCLISGSSIFSFFKNSIVSNIISIDSLVFLGTAVYAYTNVWSFNVSNKSSTSDSKPLMNGFLY